MKNLLVSLVSILSIFLMSSISYAYPVGTIGDQVGAKSVDDILNTPFLIKQAYGGFAASPIISRSIDPNTIELITSGKRQEKEISIISCISKQSYIDKRSSPISTIERKIYVAVVKDLPTDTVYFIYDANEDFSGGMNNLFTIAPLSFNNLTFNRLLNYRPTPYGYEETGENKIYNICAAIAVKLGLITYDTKVGFVPTNI